MAIDEVFHAGWQEQIYDGLTHFRTLGVHFMVLSQEVDDSILSLGALLSSTDYFGCHIGGDLAVVAGILGGKMVLGDGYLVYPPCFVFQAGIKLDVPLIEITSFDSFENGEGGARANLHELIGLLASEDSLGECVAHGGEVMGARARAGARTG